MLGQGIRDLVDQDLLREPRPTPLGQLYSLRGLPRELSVDQV